MDQDAFIEHPDGRDAVLERLESQIVAAAFARLPEKYRNVLSATYFDQLRPRHLAEWFELRPNAVSVLRLRALEKLRSEYLGQHLAKPCRARVLGAFRPSA